MINSRHLDKFIAIDVETANRNIGSICQIGIAYFEGGIFLPEKSHSFLIDPEEDFENSWVHNIDEFLVKGKPKFPEVFNKIFELLNGQQIVSHTLFDKSSLYAAIEKYELVEPEILWLDSAKMVRNAIPALRKKGYGLKNVCEILGISFQHHDALEDARAAGLIVEHIKTLDQQADLLSMGSYVSQKISEIDPYGPFIGQNIVFTGALSNGTRSIVENLAREHGFTVKDSVTGKTDILVRGIQKKVEKSRKELSAEKIIKDASSKNVSPRLIVLTESDFYRMLEETTSLKVAS